MSHDHQDLKGEPASGPVRLCGAQSSAGDSLDLERYRADVCNGDVVLRYKLARIIVNTTFEDQLQTQPGG